MILPSGCEDILIPSDSLNDQVYDVCYSPGGDRIAISRLGEIMILNRLSTENSGLKGVLTGKDGENRRTNSKNPVFSQFSGLTFLASSATLDGSQLNEKQQMKRPTGQSNTHQIGRQTSPTEKTSSFEDISASFQANWQIESILKTAHDGPIYRISWAPEDYGSLFASCSEDRTIGIWMRVVKADSSKWISRTKIRDNPKSVTSVQFAPHHYGLRLASSCDDGHVRIYQPQDMAELKTWEIEDQFMSHVAEPKGCSALCWNTSPEEVMLLAVAGKNGSLKLWGKVSNAVNRRWRLLQEGDFRHTLGVKDITWCPNFARPYELICTCGGIPSVLLWRFNFEYDERKRFIVDEAAKSMSSYGGALSNRKDSTMASSDFIKLKANHFEAVETPEGASNNPNAVSLRGRRPVGRSHLGVTPNAAVRASAAEAYSHSSGKAISEKEEKSGTSDRYGTLFLLQMFDMDLIYWSIAWNFLGTSFASASDVQVSVWRRNSDSFWYISETIETVKLHTVDKGESSEFARGHLVDKQAASKNFVHTPRDVHRSTFH